MPLFAAAAALAAAAATCDPSAYSDGVVYGDGDNLRSFAADDAGACCSACGAEGGCTSWTLATAGKYAGTCWLHAGGNARVAPKANRTSGRSPAPAGGRAYAVRVGGVISRVDAAFKSWNIDPSQNREWETRDLADEKLRYLARQSLPGFLRFGGSGADSFSYWCDSVSPGGNGGGLGKQPHHCLNQTWFDNLMGFSAAAGAKMVFGLNIGPRSGGRWDPTQARRLIAYAQSKGYAFYGFELGNEQARAHSAKSTAADFAVLAGLLEEMYPDAASRPKLIGPDVGITYQNHQGHKKDIGSKLQYLNEFAAECVRLGVPLHALTHHEYGVRMAEYSATPPPASKLDVTAAIARRVNASLAPLAAHGIQIWAGEIGPHNGKSPPCDHSSMRWANFADTFWYLDAMGAKAANGYAAFCRQDFVGIDYGMLDCATDDPLPDYYGGVLWSMLMGTAVVNATSTDPATVRAYAHCAAGSAAAPAGGLTVLLLNLADAAANVTIRVGLGSAAEHAPAAYTAYVLTGPGGTNSTRVALNGRPLRMQADGTLPALPGAAGAGTVQLPPASIAFAVVHGAGAAAGCGR